MTPTRCFDVLVVGGEPGGSSAAIACAEAGLRVAVLERERFPRDLPGETLHPGVEPLLRRLGVLDPVLAARFLRHEGHWVLWDRDRGAPLHWVPFGKDGGAGPPWRGFQAWRADFDSLLLQRARALGATAHQPCKAAEPLRGEGGRITGVVTSSALQLRARFVVDAAGGRHWIARRLGLPVEYHSPRLVARYGYAEGECPARDEAPALVADRHGWTWAARVRPGRYAWTRLPLRCATGNDSRLPPEELRGDGLGPWGRTRGRTSPGEPWCPPRGRVTSWSATRPPW